MNYSSKTGIKGYYWKTKNKTNAESVVPDCDLLSKRS